MTINTVRGLLRHMEVTLSRTHLLSLYSYTLTWGIREGLSYTINCLFSTDQK